MPNADLSKPSGSQVPASPHRELKTRSPPPSLLLEEMHHQEVESGDVRWKCVPQRLGGGVGGREEEKKLMEGGGRRGEGGGKE